MSFLLDIAKHYATMTLNLEINPQERDQVMSRSVKQNRGNNINTKAGTMSRWRKASHHHARTVAKFAIAQGDWDAATIDHQLPIWSSPGDGKASYSDEVIFT